MLKLWISAYETCHGTGAVAVGEQGVSQVWLPGDSVPHCCQGESALSRDAARQLALYFQGRLQQFDLEVDISHLTPFRRHILKLAMQIPYGTVTSYGALATLAGSPGAARAVGGAMAANPVPVVIPCHRVLSTSGALTGYSGAGGIMMKKILLNLEGVDFIGVKKTKI